MESDRRGQGLSVNAIILIVLGVVVLAVLIYGFTIGFNQLRPYLPESNVDAILTACMAACTAGSDYQYCSFGRELKTEDVELSGVTCDYLASNNLYGADSCGSAVNCGKIEDISESSIDAVNARCSDAVATMKDGAKNELVYRYLIDNKLETSLCVAKNLASAQLECASRESGEGMVNYITRSGVDLIEVYDCGTG